MHSFRADSRLFRDALERLGEASSAPADGQGPEAGKAGAGIDFVSDRREVEPPRVIGRLVSLNGTQGVISCPLDTSEEDWSVGHLITIVHKTARLVGAVCDVENSRRPVVGDGGQHRPRDGRVERRDCRRFVGSAVLPSRRKLVPFPGRGCAPHPRRRSSGHLRVSRARGGRDRPVEPEPGDPGGNRRRRIDQASLRCAGIDWRRQDHFGQPSVAEVGCDEAEAQGHHL